jgi:hypothetical protein
MTPRFKKITLDGVARHAERCVGVIELFQERQDSGLMGPGI